ncbi:MAG TPA: hypothetical protein PKL65_02305 [Bacteroidales bacterium]|nr:hypothetical protein [Bacteroidales bacterium]HNR41038.1 hypothetical protein [Bacteroidales bacterium]
MKTITLFLIRFALSATALTIIFRYGLSYGMENKSAFVVASAAIIYGITMFILGWYFGKKDGEYLPIYDVGFRFHFTTYLVFNTVSLLWFVLGLNAHNEKVKIIYITAIIWGAVLITHFLFFLWTRKNSINNLYKEDLFD